MDRVVCGSRCGLAAACARWRIPAPLFLARVRPLSPRVHAGTQRDKAQGGGGDAARTSVLMVGLVGAGGSMSADTPQQHRASSEHANKEPSAAVPVANGTAAGHKDDAQKLKGENEQLLSELQVMKQQMQVVQSREKGITRAYLGVCRDLDHVSAASSTPSCYCPAPLRPAFCRR